MEPIIIEDVPSSVTDEGMNPSFGISFSAVIPVIEDVETPGEILAKMPVETPAKIAIEMLIEMHDEITVETIVETCTKTQLTQYSK